MTTEPVRTRSSRYSLVLALALVACGVCGRAHAQCVAASEPATPIIPAETTAPVLVTLPSPGSSTQGVAAAEIEAPAGAPREPIVVFGGSPCEAAHIVVQQSVVVNVGPAATAASPPPESAADDEPEEEPFEPTIAMQLEGFADRVDFAGVGFTFDGADGVPAVVRALRIDPAVAGNAPVALGGISFAVSGRPQPWLRGPELRLSFGGGTLGGSVVAPGVEGVSISLGGLFAFRLEGAFGVQHRVGPVSLFAQARVGWGAYFVSARTQETRLGDLGGDTLSAHRLELGTTVGASLLLGGSWRFEAAWRRTFMGTASDGLLFGISAELPAGD